MLRPSFDGVLAALNLSAENHDIDSLHIQEAAPLGGGGRDDVGRADLRRGHTVFWATESPTGLALHARHVLFSGGLWAVVQNDDEGVARRGGQARLGGFVMCSPWADHFHSKDGKCLCFRSGRPSGADAAPWRADIR